MSGQSSAARNDRDKIEMFTVKISKTSTWPIDGQATTLDTRRFEKSKALKGDKQKG